MKSLIPQLVVVTVIAVVSWGVGSWRDSAVMDRRLDQLDQRQVKIEDDSKTLYTLRAEMTGLTEQMKGRREDMRSYTSAVLGSQSRR